jgi:parallel beta-helix repeat protein
VVVSDTVNYTFSNIQSQPTDTYLMGNVGDKERIVSWHAYQQNGQVIQSNYPNHWRYTLDQWLNGYHNVLTKNYTELLQSSSRYIPSVGQKMDYWNGIVTKISDYDTFYVSGTTSLFTSQYYPVDSGTTITNFVVDGGGSNSGTIWIRDPWLKDTTDSQFYTAPYGYHNLGMSVPFKPESSPLQLTIGSKYVGVLLGRSVTSGSYYCVRAPIAQSVNGYLAFFCGWTATGAALGDGGPKPDGYDSAAVVFAGSNATVSAQYKYYTVTYSSTVPSGTWTTAGTLTIPSGVTLTLSAGTVLKFPPSASLVVNGNLVGNGGTITASNGWWNGITMTGTSNNSITNVTITSAIHPITVSSCSNATISNCTIDTASSNGVTFTQGSTGTLSGCMVQHCSSGNGIVIQGGSSPTITLNTVQHNYYNGIYSAYNGTGTATISSNTLIDNGMPGGQYYCHGINFTNSHGVVTCNWVQQSNWGYVAYTYGSISGGIAPSAGNTSTQNNYGLLVYDHSQIYFGYIDPRFGLQNGYNNFFGNVACNASLISYTNLYASYDYWGVPGQAVGIYCDGTSIYNAGNPLQGQGQCSGGYQAAPTVSMSIKNAGTDSMSVSEDLKLAREARGQNDTASAKGYFKKAFATGSTVLREQALGEFYLLLRDFKDPGIDQEIEACAKSASDLNAMASDLLISSYVAKGRYDDVIKLATSIQSKYAGKEPEQKGLIQLAFLKEFDSKYAQVSLDAIGQLKRKFTSSVDAALLVALGDNAVGIPKGGNITPQSTVNVDSVNGGSLSSYPNPFNPSTQIRFTVKQAGFVSLKVYDMIGREVATLVNETRNPGSYTVNWNASQFASGIYFARFESGGKFAIQKLIYLK